MLGALMAMLGNFIPLRVFAGIIMVMNTKEVVQPGAIMVMLGIPTGMVVIAVISTKEVADPGTIIAMLIIFAGMMVIAMIPAERVGEPRAMIT